jgi:hypothetical protein
MSIDKVLDTLSHIEIRALGLFKQGRILKSTLTLIRCQVKEIRDSLTDTRGDPIERQSIIDSIGWNIFILNKLVDVAATDTHKNEIRILAQEMLEIILRGCAIDLFLIESGSSEPSPLWNYNNRGENEVTFLLLFPSMDYLNKDRIGLIAHETAHVHDIVKRFADSMIPRRKKIDESLADILGLCVAGPLFAHSLSFFIINDIGLEKASKILDNHPSCTARAIILHYISLKLWENPCIKKAICGMLERVLHERPPTLQEDVLISKCLREYYKNEEEFSKVKIDEKRIVSFKNEDRDSRVYMLSSTYV